MLGQLRYVALCCFETLVMLFGDVPHKVLGQGNARSEYWNLFGKNSVPD